MDRLGPEQVEQFFEVGYLVLPNLFEPREIEQMREAFRRLEQAAGRLARAGMYRGSLFVLDRLPRDRVKIHRVVWCGAAEPVLSRYGRDPRLLRSAAELLGSRRMHQLINQAHFKLPGDGVEFPWHQDSTHRRYGGEEWKDVNGRGSYVQTVIAVDDVTTANGPLEFVVGSSRLGHVPMREGSPPACLGPGAEVVAPTMRAGSVLLFGPYVFHRSGPNRSDRPRRVLINGFAFPGANARDYPGDGAGRVVFAPD